VTSTSPRPANARVERTPDELRVRMPAEGMRRPTLRRLGFAVVFLTICGFFTVEILRSEAYWAAKLLLIPFWLAGLGMLGGIAGQLWGTRSVRINREG
jgi:hypothetical protein